MSWFYRYTEPYKDNNAAYKVSNDIEAWTEKLIEHRGNNSPTKGLQSKYKSEHEVAKFLKYLNEFQN